MKVSVFSVFAENRGKILTLWKEKFFINFSEAKTFFVKEVDSFQNPLSSRIDEVFSHIIDSIKPEFSLQSLAPHLERLSQVLAVHESSGSKSMEVFVQLRSIIREEFGSLILERFGIEGLLKIEDLINSMMLIAFDNYLKFRERLFEIKYQEWKRNHYLLLKRAGLVYDPMEAVPPLEKTKDN